MNTQPNRHRNVKLKGKCCADILIRMYGLDAGDCPPAGMQIPAVCPICSNTVPLLVQRVEEGALPIDRSLLVTPSQ